jgi:hypothetical protein
VNIMVDQSAAPDMSEPGDGTPVSAEPDTISLQLGDLLPDSAGNVVIEYDGGNLAVQLVTDQSVVEHGVAVEAVDASGGDLSGLAYFAFGDGITVYFPTDISVHIVPVA